MKRLVLVPLAAAYVVGEMGGGPVGGLFAFFGAMFVVGTFTVLASLFRSA